MATSGFPHADRLLSPSGYPASLGVSSGFGSSQPVSGQGFFYGSGGGGGGGGGGGSGGSLSSGPGFGGYSHSPLPSTAGGSYYGSSGPMSNTGGGSTGGGGGGAYDVPRASASSGAGATDYRPGGYALGASSGPGMRSAAGSGGVAPVPAMPPADPGAEYALVLKAVRRKYVRTVSRQAGYLAAVGSFGLALLSVVCHLPTGAGPEGLDPGAAAVLALAPRSLDNPLLAWARALAGMPGLAALLLTTAALASIAARILTHLLCAIPSSTSVTRSNVSAYTHRKLNSWMARLFWASILAASIAILADFSAVVMAAAAIACGAVSAFLPPAFAWPAGPGADGRLLPTVPSAPVGASASDALVIMPLVRTLRSPLNMAPSLGFGSSGPGKKAPTRCLGSWALGWLCAAGRLINLQPPGPAGGCPAGRDGAMPSGAPGADDASHSLTLPPGPAGGCPAGRDGAMPSGAPGADDASHSLTLVPSVLPAGADASTPFLCALRSAAQRGALQAFWSAGRLGLGLLAPLLLFAWFYHINSDESTFLGDAALVTGFVARVSVILFAVWLGTRWGPLFLLEHLFGLAPGISSVEMGRPAAASAAVATASANATAPGAGAVRPGVGSGSLPSAFGAGPGLGDFPGGGAFSLAASSQAAGPRYGMSSGGWVGGAPGAGSHAMSPGYGAFSHHRGFHQPSGLYGGGLGYRGLGGSGSVRHDRRLTPTYTALSSWVTDAPRDLAHRVSQAVGGLFGVGRGLSRPGRLSAAAGTQLVSCPAGAPRRNESLVAALQHPSATVRRTSLLELRNLLRVAGPRRAALFSQLLLPEGTAGPGAVTGAASAHAPSTVATLWTVGVVRPLLAYLREVTQELGPYAAFYQAAGRGGHLAAELPAMGFGASGAPAAGGLNRLFPESRRAVLDSHASARGGPRRRAAGGGALASGPAATGQPVDPDLADHVGRLSRAADSLVGALRAALRWAFIPPTAADFGEAADVGMVAAGAAAVPGAASRQGDRPLAVPSILSGKAASLAGSGPGADSAGPMSSSTAAAPKVVSTAPRPPITYVELLTMALDRLAGLSSGQSPVAAAVGELRRHLGPRGAGGAGGGSPAAALELIEALYHHAAFVQLGAEILQLGVTHAREEDPRGASVRAGQLIPMLNALMDLQRGLVQLTRAVARAHPRRMPAAERVIADTCADLARGVGAAVAAIAGIYGRGLLDIHQDQPTVSVLCTSFSAGSTAGGGADTVGAEALSPQNLDDLRRLVAASQSAVVPQ
ncbi:hypothetical protein H696_05557 [Fonticula alba]|uniref:Uncharacterized protein n=1 Tax=Fonticula alba TaxID=691883 RepID=A0A058Z0M7_FONAL|nr:hypothetical protein H696_05557 [Fonticula alba]KCV67824.1 hypothetical protein H696_05557 [Fonticula alba]|eukprot:XP_009497644.1 hypothetical protein H696_05557 [Fonticula alba]